MQQLARSVARDVAMNLAWPMDGKGQEFPSGAILHFDASLGFIDQTGNQQAVFIGSAYPTVTAGFAVNEAGKEWGFDTTTGPVKAALESGEVTLVQVVTLPLMSSLTDATDYSLFGDLLYVRRDGTAGSFKVSDGTNSATVAYDWSEGEVVKLVVKSFGGITITASKAPGAYYVENVIRNRPCWLCPSGIANYTNGAYHLECTGDEGDTALTITGGDSVAHAGSAIWKAVVEYPDGELEFNIVDVVSDPTCTLVYPLKKDGPVKVYAAWQSATGQHYSLKGVQCYAETLYRLDRRYAVRDESVFSYNYTDVFAVNTWAKKSPLVWQPIGGLAANAFRVDSNPLNPMTAGKRVFAGCSNAAQFTSTAAGHGVQLTVPVSEAFTGRIEVSTGISAESGFAGLVSITVGGVEVYSGTFGTYVKTHQVYVSGATNIVVTIARTTTGTTSTVYRVGALHLIRNVGAAGTLIDKDAKVLLCGDSWLDPAHPTGAGFMSRLEALIAADGGTGAVIDGATQGMTTAWALKWLPVYLAEYNPDVCIINFFTNDNNNLTGQTFLGPDNETYDLNVASHTVWGANIEALVAMCKEAGCTPIVMLPDTTSSESQSVRSMAMQNFAGIPVLVKEWLTQATTSELANAAFVGNVRNKLPGRVIKCVSDNVDYVAVSSVAASAWVAGTKAMNVTVGETAGAHGVCDASLPLSAQPCKGHALPIGTSKVTVFPGVATSAQIEESK